MWGLKALSEQPADQPLHLSPKYQIVSLYQGGAGCHEQPAKINY